MQINVSKLIGGVVGLVSLVLLGGFLYLAYMLFLDGPKPNPIPTVGTINTAALGPKAQKAASALVNASDKILLKDSDLAFTKSYLYMSFTDIPDSVPLSDSRGRPDPFVPYVAP